MKIAHVITGTGLGGAESMLYRLLSAPAFAKHESAVMSLAPTGHMGERIRACGIPCDTLALPPSRFSVKALKQFRAWLAARHPDLIMGWMYHGNLIAQIGKLFVPARVIWNIRQSLHWWQQEKLTTSAVIRFGAWSSRLADAIIYNSVHAAEQHEAVGYSASHRVVIPNGFDTGVFQPNPSARRVVREKLKVDSGALLVGMIARYHPVKGHDVFLSAASRVRKARPYVRFILAGTGIDEANMELQKRISDLGLRDVVSLLGEQEEPQRIMAALDIAVSASYAEAFPNVVGEAMACGTPCVATRVGDVDSIVGDCGRVVEAGNPEALAQGLLELVEAPAQARQDLGKRARMRMQERYELQLIAEHFEACIATLALTPQ